MAIPHIAYRILPGIKWFEGYTTRDAVADMIAGITVGLTVLPQGLAYATLGGLEPQFGLYSAFVGGIVYAFLGSCRQVTIGPTALLALMTSRHTSLGLDSGPTYAILLCLISGIIELLMALLRLGSLVDLISLPVTVGFTSATALIIMASQLKGLFGLKCGSGSGFVATIESLVTNLNKIRYGDLALGVTAIIILLYLKKLKELRLSTNGPRSKIKQFLNSTFWLISTGRNALIVVISSLIAFYTCEGVGHRGDSKSEQCPFILTGRVKGGFPNVHVPHIETSIQGANNTVIHQNLGNMLTELGPSVVTLPIIAVLGNVAISKAFGGAGISPARELVALSMCNIVGSFFCSMPVTGSFSRSAVNHASGVRTPIGGFYTSGLVLLALWLLAPYFQYIPKASLSAVIMSAVIFMIEFEVIKPLWRCSRRELLPGAITFIVSLAVGVELGLALGVSVDMGFLIYRAARPHLNIAKLKTTNGFEYILIRPRHSSLCFPAIEWVRGAISKAINTHGALPVVLDCTTVHDFDFTAAHGIGALHKDLQNMKVPFYFMQASKDILVILKECTRTDFITLEAADDLEALLVGAGNQESAPEVVTPLLTAR